MRLTVRHATTYTYDPPADRCALRLRLYPPSFTSQRVLNWKVSVNDQYIPALMTTATGDGESIWTKSNVGAEVLVLAEGEVEVDDTAGVVRGLRDTVRPPVFLRPTPLTEADAKITELAESITGASPLDRMHGLFNAVADAIAYKPASTTSSTTAAQAMKAGQGVCQDHAHVFISAGRLADIPMRYVGGYLKMDGLTEQEAGHGWAEAFVTGLGWVGFDVSNAICPDERYVRVATGCDYGEAAPVTGITQGAGESLLSVHLSVDSDQVGQQQQQSAPDVSGGGQKQSQSQG